MDWKRYWNEFITSVGVISLIYVFLKFNTQFIENLELALLQVYIICAVFTFLTYHLFPKLINNFQARKKLFYTVVAAEFVILFTVTNVLLTLANLQEKSISRTLYTIPSLIILLGLLYTIIYFVQGAYTKRMNKKLQEYKERDDTPPDDNA